MGYLNPIEFMEEPVDCSEDLMGWQYPDPISGLGTVKRTSVGNTVFATGELGQPVLIYFSSVY